MEGEKFTSCPLKQVDENVYGYIQAFNLYEKGILPNVGGWCDQSSKYIESMQFISSEISQREKERLEDGKRKLRRKNNFKR